MPNTAIVLPWVELREPLRLGSVTILPKAHALAAVSDDQRVALSDLLDSFVHFAPVRSAPACPDDPVDSKSCAVLVDYYEDEDTRQIDEAIAAIHALMFATIAENQHGGRANGAVFEHEVHSKLELGFLVRIQHHMEGWTFNGFNPASTPRVKPWYVGRFHRRGCENGKLFVEALLRWWSAEPAHVGELLRVLRAATSESPDLEPGMVFALYYKAMAIAASAPGEKDNREHLFPRVRALVAPYLDAPTVPGDAAYRVVQAWDATREARNSGVHLNKVRRERFDFEAGGATLQHIAFRVLYALVVARLARDGHLDASDRWSDLLIADVPATESWLEALSHPPDDVVPGVKWRNARRAARDAHLKARLLASGINLFAART